MTDTRPVTSGFDPNDPEKTIPLSAIAPSRRSLSWQEIWERLLRVGLGETAMRLGSSLASMAMVLMVVWVMNNFYIKSERRESPVTVVEAAAPTPAPVFEQPTLIISLTETYDNGIYRMTELHTNLPARPRFDVTKYVVVKGDNIFDIAAKFNLKPETILWGNYYTLVDNPTNLRPGQELNILPVDGVYYEWHSGDGLNGVAEFYRVTPDAIIDWPGNNLKRETLGDLSNPNIAPGTWLVVPGGKREFVTWSAPRISRENPAVAKVLGPGACGTIVDGPVGVGTYVWPAPQRFLSGYKYSPETNHWGIDIGGVTGDPIFASDNGVVVYSGWNDWGYGNVVVIDHGFGWQTLYAHLSAITVGCGSYVYQGNVIGYMGSTGNSSGPHLHFEMRSEAYGRPNPLNFLQ